MAGYESTIFVSPPPDDFGCPLCLNILNDPRQCLNGHNFCQTCIRNAVSVRKECPMCKIYLTTETLGRSLYVHKCIQELKTVCCSFKNSKQNEEHCSWTGLMADRETHYLNCDFRLLDCGFEGCDVHVQKRCHEEHSKICQFRTIKCKYCKDVMLFPAFENHCKTCQLRPIPCPNNCSLELLRIDIDEHKRTDCPNETITCLYFTAFNSCSDCKVDIPRGEMISHLENPARVAIAMDCRLKYLTEMTKQISELTLKLQRKAAAADSELTKPKTKITVVDKKITLVEDQVKQTTNNPSTSVSSTLTIAKTTPLVDFASVEKRGTLVSYKVDSAWITGNIISNVETGSSDYRIWRSAEFAGIGSKVVIKNIKHIRLMIGSFIIAGTKNIQVEVLGFENDAEADIMNFPDTMYSCAFINKEDVSIGLPLFKSDMRFIFQDPATDGHAPLLIPVDAHLIRLNTDVFSHRACITAIGTNVQYLNRKDKWINAKILRIDKENNDNVIVLNAYDCELSVHLDVIKLLPNCFVLLASHDNKLARIAGFTPGSFVGTNLTNYNGLEVTYSLDLEIRSNKVERISGICIRDMVVDDGISSEEGSL